MAGVNAGRWVASLLAGVAACGLLAPSARALEAFDGRIQAHGFAEMQFRGISSQFQEELDLTMWYNILNVELEFDIAPDGWAFFDLIEAYVRVEGRYDCIYTRGCGMFRSADAWGNRAGHIPTRLRDGVNEDFGGVIQVGDPNPRIAGNKPTPVAVYGLVPNTDFQDPNDFSNPPISSGFKCATVIFCDDGSGEHPDFNPKLMLDVRDKEGFPGIASLFGLKGADNLAFTADDPARYTFEPVLDWLFYLTESRGSAGATNVLGPVLPENTFTGIAMLRHKANPFRGERPPTTRGNFRVDSVIDPRLPGAGTSHSIRPRDPATESADAGRAVDPNNGRLFREKNTFGEDPDGFFPKNEERFRGFSGDFSGIVPKAVPTFVEEEFNPVSPPDAFQNITGQRNLTGPFPAGPQTGDFSVMPDSNIALVAGQGELPMRPAPDRGNLETSANPELLEAQGLYVPSRGLRKALKTQDLDEHGFNIDETNRAWNRGASQDDEKEFKEGYFDLEFFDSRLWARLGKQTIVWGKTELFPTTDQFNPQDFSLASLPSLEEGRIPLWAGRFVYSFYDVGPLDDVRAEFAFNFDQFEPHDLGACGEPYTMDVVCGLTFGIAAHGLLGVGVAGIDRPPDPWRSVKGLEYGVRVEWRWDRYSFALVDFYGFTDLPYPDPVSFFERNVDLATGRPLIMRLFGEARGSCTAPRPGAVDPGTDERLFSDAGAWQSMTPDGIGRDPRCLKAGGAPGGPNENALDGPGTSPQNALQNQPSNLQLFTAICSATIGTSDLDPGSCALNIFGSEVLAVGGATGSFELVEFIGSTFAGDPEMNSVIQAVTRRQDVPPPGTWAPLAGLNRDGGTAGTSPRDSVHCLGVDGPGGNPDCDPDTGGLWSARGLGGIGTDGVISARDSTINKPNPNLQPGFPIPGGGFRPDYLCTRNLTVNFRDCRIASFFNQLEDFLTLDNTLTNEQRALLGCGPFWGTRCDASDLVRDRTGALLFPAGGGVDLLNAEASFLVQSWVGVEGTETVPSASLAEWSFALANPAMSADHTAAVSRLTNACALDEDGNPIVDGSGNCLEPISPSWLTTSSAMPQPSAINLGTGDMFPLGAVCTYYNEETGALSTLPGCRGIETFRVSARANPADPASAPTEFTIGFEDGYLPSIDGCVFGKELGFGGAPLGAGVGLAISGVPVVVEDQDGNPITVDTESTDGGYRGELGRQLAACGDASHAFGSSSRQQTDITANGAPLGDSLTGARTLYHPVAGCRTPGNLNRSAITNPGTLPTAYSKRHDSDDGESCFVALRDFVQNFNNDPTSVQMFRSEGAALSFNVQMFLVSVSCQGDPPEEIEADPECFDVARPYRPDRCSYAAPQFCQSVKSFLGAGVQRNTLRAGGRNGRGRRTFVWQSGGEVILRYKKRNVFGFSMDFAEDVTKTNIGMEFTWMVSNPFLDGGSITNVTTSDTLNMTVSVDRPTFINFLNANRTFFFNSQWFFSYVTNYKDTFGSNGPFNVLATFTVFTGYFQDRLLPIFTAVYDFRSRSGAYLPSVRYRFTEALEATVGFKLFYGRTELRDMPVRGIGPAGNQAGPDAYKVGVNNLLANFRKRDEVFLSIRWTF